MGLCGSGVISTVAALAGAGLIGSDGAFAAAGSHPRIRASAQTRQLEALLVPGMGSRSGRDIVFTQQDVRAVQLGKAALRAGIEILLREEGVTQLDHIYLAGTFGNHLEPRDIVAIGLVPPLPVERIESIGNAAGDGARMALFNRRERRRAHSAGAIDAGGGTVEPRRFPGHVRRGHRVVRRGHRARRSIEHARIAALVGTAFGNAGVFLQALQFLHGVLRAAVSQLGYARVERMLLPFERSVKGLMFDCRMCGVCLLSKNGMSCPMNCPKFVRNGPCGGVREDGGCEVDPDMQCVWVEGWLGVQGMSEAALSPLPNAPANARFAGSSSWMRLARGEHGPAPLSGAPATATDSRFERLLEAGGSPSPPNFPRRIRPTRRRCTPAWITFAAMWTRSMSPTAAAPIATCPAWACPHC